MLVLYVTGRLVSTQVRGALCWWWFMGDAVVTGKNIWTNVSLGDIRTEKRVLGYINKRRRLGWANVRNCNCN